MAKPSDTLARDVAPDTVSDDNQWIVKDKGGRHVWVVNQPAALSRDEAVENKGTFATLLDVGVPTPTGSLDYIVVGGVAHQDTGTWEPRGGSVGQFTTATIATTVATQQDVDSARIWINTDAGDNRMYRARSVVAGDFVELSPDTTTAYLATIPASGAASNDDAVGAQAIALDKEAQDAALADHEQKKIHNVEATGSAADAGKINALNAAGTDYELVAPARFGTPRGDWDVSTETGFPAPADATDGDWYVVSGVTTSETDAGGKTWNALTVKNGDVLLRSLGGTFAKVSREDLPAVGTVAELNTGTDDATRIFSSKTLAQSFIPWAWTPINSDNFPAEIGKRYRASSGSIDLPTTRPDGSALEIGDSFIVQNRSQLVGTGTNIAINGEVLLPVSPIPSTIFGVQPSLEREFTWNGGRFEIEAERPLLLPQVGSSSGSTLFDGHKYAVTNSTDGAIFKLEGRAGGYLSTRLTSSSTRGITIEQEDMASATAQFIMEDGSTAKSFEIPLSRMNQVVEFEADVNINKWRIYRPWELEQLNNNSTPWTSNTFYNEGEPVQAARPSDGVLFLYSRKTEGTSGAGIFDTTEEDDWIPIGEAPISLPILETVSVTFTGYVTSWTQANNPTFYDVAGNAYDMNDWKIVSDTSSTTNTGNSFIGGFAPPVNGSRTIVVAYQGSAQRRGLLSVQATHRAVATTALTSVSARYFSGSVETYTRGGALAGFQTYTLNGVDGWDFLTHAGLDAENDASSPYDPLFDYVGTNREIFSLTAPNSNVAGTLTTVDGVILEPGKTYNLIYQNDRAAADSVAAIADDAATVAEVALMEFVNYVEPSPTIIPVYAKFDGDEPTYDSGINKYPAGSTANIANFPDNSVVQLSVTGGGTITVDGTLYTLEGTGTAGKNDEIIAFEKVAGVVAPLNNKGTDGVANALLYPVGNFTAISVNDSGTGDNGAVYKIPTVDALQITLPNSADMNAAEGIYRVRLSGEWADLATQTTVLSFIDDTANGVIMGDGFPDSGNEWVDLVFDDVGDRWIATTGGDVTLTQVLPSYDEHASVPANVRLYLATGVGAAAEGLYRKQVADDSPQLIG